MEYRRLLQPLPLVLIFLFVAVAVGDLIQSLTEDSPPPPEIVGPTLPRFEALEPMIDFRSDRADPGYENRPAPELAAGHWSTPEQWGVWATGAAARLGLEFATGGHRAVIVECQPSGAKRPVRRLRLTINGVDCGEVALEAGWKRYRFALPEEAVRSGHNDIVFGFPDREDARPSKRSLQIRRLGWYLGQDAGIDSFDVAAPVVIDVDAEKIALRRSGTFELPLVLDDRTDALQMRYRFPSGAGRAEVVVARTAVTGGGVDDELRRSMSADDQISGRIRFPLHGRRGEFVLRIRADLASPDDRLLVSSLRLVEEGDPTRRPWAANRPPS